METSPPASLTEPGSLPPLASRDFWQLVSKPKPAKGSAQARFAGKGLAEGTADAIVGSGARDSSPG